MPLTMTAEREAELRYKPRGGRTNELRELFTELDATRASLNDTIVAVAVKGLGLLNPWDDLAPNEPPIEWRGLLSEKVAKLRQDFDAERAAHQETQALLDKESEGHFFARDKLAETRAKLQWYENALAPNRQLLETQAIAWELLEALEQCADALDERGEGPDYNGEAWRVTCRLVAKAKGVLPAI